MSSSQEPAWLVLTHPDGERQEVRLTTALTTIGRSEQNVVEVLDPKLSRFHCEVERRGAQWLVRDCNSRNGTTLDGAPCTSPKPLVHGSKIGIGTTVIEFLLRPPDDVRTDRAMVLALPGTSLPTPAGAEGIPALVDRGSSTMVDAMEQGDATEMGVPSVPARGGTTSLGALGQAYEVAGLGLDLGAITPGKPGSLRPTTSFDARQTARIEGPMTPRSDPWARLAHATARVVDAASRGELIERAIQEAPGFVQARGGLLVLGDEKDPDSLAVTASLGLDKDSRARCVDLARRVLATRKLVHDDRRALGVPLRGRTGVQGALVLHDLPAAVGETAPEVQALERLAAIVARTLQTSLLIEDVRREERAAGAHRLAHDLRGALLPGDPSGVAGLDAAWALGPAEGLGRAFFDRTSGPVRAGRAELYLALGDVPDLGAPDLEVGGSRFRRKGERTLVPLLAQAELRGALRALLGFVPRVDEVLGHLHRGVRAGWAGAALGRFSLLLARFDPQGSALRLAGAGHPAVVVRRVDGKVELLPAASSTPLGTGDEPRLAEREVRWAAGDLVLVVTGAVEQTRAPKGPGGLPGALLGDAGLSRIAHTLDPTRTAAELANDVLAAVGRHAVGTAPADAAVLVLRRVPT